MERFRSVPGFHERYPHFPDISFEEFLSLSEARRFKERASNLGAYTQDFIQYFFKDPNAVRTAISEKYVSSGAYRSDMYNVRFLRTARLNFELYEFLTDMGYHSGDVKFILGLAQLPGEGRGEDQRWEKYYTPELKRAVRHKDRYIFQMYPEFDV